MPKSGYSPSVHSTGPVLVFSAISPDLTTILRMAPLRTHLADLAQPSPTPGITHFSPFPTVVPMLFRMILTLTTPTATSTDSTPSTWSSATKNGGPGLPFTLAPSLQATTLLWNPTALVNGVGDTIVGPGAPALNTGSKFFFPGRSDNFDSSQNSGNPDNARFDTEGIRLSNDGLKVYISDEYGPYVYEFDRQTGQRLRSFEFPTCVQPTPSCFFVSNLSSMGSVEISGNSTGRVANKGMEGLAITPDGTTLVG